MGVRLVIAAASAAICAAMFAPAASAGALVRFDRIKGVDSPGTPGKYDRVGILKTGPRRAPNILVLNPGTSASAAYFQPLAKTIVAKTRGRWQVWSVERRENLLEDHSVFNRAKAGKATPKQVFDFYLGYITDLSITNHFQPIPNADVAYAKEWGMKVEIGDLRRVVKRAQKHGRHVVVGGHSLGGSITTAYATWDFDGKPGAKGLDGLLYIDGGSGSTPLTADEATERLNDLNAPAASPWLVFGGIPSPFTGLFNTAGALGAIVAPNAASLAYDFPLLPDNLKPPVPPTNLGQYGYALDTETSPPGLAAAQAHLGHLAPSGDPRGWVRAGELTPIRRYAKAFAGWGLKSLDGTAWYHPLRLTIDAGAVAAGNPNPAQAILKVRAIHGDDLSRKLRIYAFGASLGGQRVLDAASNLAEQSGIPRRNLTLVDRAATYSHNDPNTAAPKNAFVNHLIPFLKGIAR
jgi:hypothetical protein